MNNWLLIAAVPAAAAIAIFLLYRAQMRARSFSRLPQAKVQQDVVTTPPPASVRTRPFPRRYRPIPWLIAIALLAALLFFHVHYVYSLAIAAMVGLLAAQVESSRAERQLI